MYETMKAGASVQLIQKIAVPEKLFSTTRAWGEHLAECGMIALMMSWCLSRIGW
jgi:hypothetical protein